MPTEPELLPDGPPPEPDAPAAEEPTPSEDPAPVVDGTPSNPFDVVQQRSDALRKDAEDRDARARAEREAARLKDA